MGSALAPRQWAWAHRLMLAEITDDPDASELVAAEVGDCPSCWRLVANYATLLAAVHIPPADRADAADSLFGGLQFALDTPRGVVLELGGPDEESPT